MYTAYAIAVIINNQLAEQGHKDLEIRTQMMYNYAKQGMIVKGIRDTTYRYTQEQTDAFVEKFVANRIAKKTGTKVEKAPVTVEDIDAQVAKLLQMKSELQGTQNA